MRELRDRWRQRQLPLHIVEPYWNDERLVLGAAANATLLSKKAYQKCIATLVSTTQP